MRINADSFVGVGICILGLVGVGYAIGVHSKMKVMCDRLDTSIDNLANNTEIDIPAKVIDQADSEGRRAESYSAVKRPRRRSWPTRSGRSRAGWARR